MTALVDTLEEMGNEDEARKAAADFFAQGTETWVTNTRNQGVDRTIFLLRRTVGPGRTSAEPFERRRAAWVEERVKTSGAYPGLVWLFAYAEPALTPDEARSALSELPRFAPLTSYLDSTPRPDAFAGHAYLLAGKADEAVPYLARAVAHCSVLFPLVTRMHAALELGQAREATKDTEGACAAYKIVLERWGNAKPRSVTADKARDRAKSLACPR